MDRKEQWIDEIMSSLEGLERARAPRGLHERILRAAARPQRLSPALTWSVAAALLLWVGINIVSLQHFMQAQESQLRQQASRSIATEYFSAPSY